MPVAILAMTLVILVFGFIQSRSGPDVIVAGPDDLGHIHDLILDADGTLLVAAHTGLYRVEDSTSAVLVSGGRHDFMALASLPSGEFVASGHPDLRDPQWRVDDKPPYMGLARSQDGGESWEPGDQLGDADFHAIAPIDDERLVAAESAGTIWFTNAQMWEQRSELAAVDLAIRPGNDAVVIGITESNELKISDDQAATWSTVSEAPPLAVIDWPEADRLVGVRPDGVIVSAETYDGEWQQIGSVAPEPEAILASGADLWVAVEGGRIFHTDGQSDVAVFYQPPAR
ncbi:MAG: exo-alpha-sialidase [Acidimicrobiales bacterium]|nr:exo-alpha-sialidase [Acidimicrobiales bacterium]